MGKGIVVLADTALLDAEPTLLLAGGCIACFINLEDVGAVSPVSEISSIALCRSHLVALGFWREGVFSSLSSASSKESRRAKTSSSLSSWL